MIDALLGALGVGVVNMSAEVQDAVGASIGTVLRFVLGFIGIFILFRLTMNFLFDHGYIRSVPWNR
jgi:hypothetical protein